MKRIALLMALFVTTAQFSSGASGPVEKVLERIASAENSPDGRRVPNDGPKISDLSDSQRHELIIEGLRSKSRAVRHEITEMINREPNNERYLDMLIDLAEHDPDADVRGSALVRVISIDMKRALPLRRKLIKDPDARVRLYALSGLLESPDSEDQSVIGKALKNEHLWIKIGLAKILALHGKSTDKDIALEGLTVDKAWFEKHPIIPTGYRWRRTSRSDHAEYYLRLIREDAIYILGRTGNQEDIPHLERAMAREALAGDKNHFGVQSQIVIWGIQLKHLPDDQQLGYLKVKLRDSRHWVQNWAVGKLCVVKGGLELIDELVKDKNHPAHNASRGQRRACLKHAPKL